MEDGVETEVAEVMGEDDEDVDSGRSSGLMAITGRPGYLVHVHVHVTQVQDDQALRKRWGWLRRFLAVWLVPFRLMEV